MASLIVDEDDARRIEVPERVAADHRAREPSVGARTSATQLVVWFAEAERAALFGADADGLEAAHARVAARTRELEAGFAGFVASGVGLVAS